MQTVLILVMALAGHALGESQRLDKTPGVVEVEKVLQRGQQIDDLDELLAALGLDCGWSAKVEESRVISPELTRQRIRLYYEGLKVRSFTLQASVDQDHYYTGAVSGYLPTIPDSVDVSAASTLTRRQVRAAVVDYVNVNNFRVNQGDIEESDLEHFHFERQVRVDFKTGAASVVVYAQGRVNIPNYIRNPKVLFDASLNVIKGRFLVRNAPGPVGGCPNANGGNDGFPGLTYGSQADQVCLATEVRGEHCCLKSDHVIIKDCQNGLDRSKAKIVRFNCADGLNDAANGGFSPNADAFYYSGVFFDVAREWGKVEVKGKPITVYTHYGFYPNSFWDGESATFGDGDSNVYPYAVRELIGHEMGHALVEKENNMVFEGECAAVDEAFGDICGKAVSAYLHSTGQLNGFNWKFADNLLKITVRDALRYMDEPTRDGRSVDHVNDFYKVASDHPALGVGIFDKAFYLTVTGGVSYKDAFEAVTLANSIYWHEDTGFFDGACGVLRAASDLGLRTDVFKASFLEVGIDLCFCELSGTA